MDTQVIFMSDSMAFRELAEAFTDPDTRKVSIDIREDGVAVKVNEYMWSPALPTVRIASA